MGQAGRDDPSVEGNYPQNTQITQIQKNPIEKNRNALGDRHTAHPKRPSNSHSQLIVLNLCNLRNLRITLWS